MLRPHSPNESLDVLFYTPWIGSLLRPGVSLPTGGAETQVLLVSQALAARGHRVGLVAFDLPGGLPPSVGGVEVLARPPYKAHRRFVGKLVETSWIWRSLRRRQADVVVKRAAGIDLGLVGVFAKLRRQRFVFSTANVVDFDYRKLMPKHRDTLLYQLGVRLADTIVVQTDEQHELCRQHFGRTPVRIKSIAEPVAEAELIQPQEPGTFVWAGRLVSYKQPMAFLDLARTMPHAKFAMVGVPIPHGRDGIELVARVREAAADTPNVELIDPLPREELGRLIAGAVAVVNTADFEGMSNVSLEAWSRGVPTLALTHDPDGVIARHDLGGFAGGEPERLRQLAEDLWLGRHNRDALRRRCLEYVATHHSASAVGQQWEAALGLQPRHDHSRSRAATEEPACVE
jgi:glycosyltransferase involved in cell wall biosynthesis